LQFDAMDSAHLCPQSPAPSPWVTRFAALVAQGGAVLDLACGHGRHARLFARLGHAVEAVDRDAEALARLGGEPNVTTRQADLEGGLWPYAGRPFSAIVVCNYLHRPLFPLLVDALAPDGVLIYETFMLGNQRLGRPANAQFLLRPNELLEAFAPRLAVVAFEQGEVARPRPAVVQRLCAVKRADLSQLRLPEPG
jgi:SAM-dependent methyltransferase